MTIRIISFLLGIIIGTSFYVYDEVVKKNMFITETNSINESVIKNLELKKQENYKIQVEKEKNILLQSLSSQNTPIQKKLIIYDNMESFENFYRTALSNTGFYEKTKKPDFQNTKEYQIIENIKKELLKSKIIFGGNNADIVLGIPKSISCVDFKIKSPCYHYNNDNNEIIFQQNEVFVIRGNKEYSQDDALSIINGTKKFDL